MDSAGTERLSKREQATIDFVAQVQDRTTSALLRYFFSHGVYVAAGDLSEAVVLEDHQDFLNPLGGEFETTTKAIQLAVDIGSISLAEKEKAMRAVYEIEEKCAEHSGDRGQLQEEASTLASIVRWWPLPPAFFAPVGTGLGGALFLLLNMVPIGLALLAGAAAYGFYGVFAYNRKKASLERQLSEVTARFDVLVTAEISPRPALPGGPDYVQAKAIGSAILVGVTALTASLYHPSHMARDAATQQSASGSDSTSPAASSSDAAVAGQQPSSFQWMKDFGWMIGKSPSDVVNDKRFRAAFNHVSRNDWKKVADRLAVTTSGGLEVKNDYIVGEGCKAHSCASDSAAFAINVTTGKGDLVFREIDHATGQMTRKTLAWSELPLDSTPLAGWGVSTDNASGATAPVQQSTGPQPSFDCTKARSDAEHLICGDAELAAADVQLAALYAKAKAAATDQTAFKERTRQEWNYREQNCHDRECLLRWYADQKVALSQIAETGTVSSN
jgi:hypothetical protein